MTNDKHSEIKGYGVFIIVGSIAGSLIGGGIGALVRATYKGVKHVVTNDLKPEHQDKLFNGINYKLTHLKPGDVESKDGKNKETPPRKRVRRTTTTNGGQRVRRTKVKDNNNKE